MHRYLLLASAVLLARVAPAQTAPHAAPQPRILGDLVDVSEEFEQPDHVHFVGSRVTQFNPATGAGLLRWERYVRQPSYSFNKMDVAYVRAESNEFPGTEYDRDPALPFEISFVTPRTLRLRFFTRDLPADARRDTDSLMLAGPVPTDRSWRVEAGDSVVRYRSAFGELRLIKQPWHIELYDAAGKLLTRTQSLNDPASFQPYTPFSYMRRTRDMGRSTAATFELQHDEKIFGTGESFTRLDKRGQKLVMWLRDGQGVQNYRQYKAVPFFLSSNGYGIFAHTSAPVTFDFGHDFDQHTVIYSGDDVMDLFVFIGNPKDVLSEYTALTGRSPVPPLWSFGLWMSRITYKAEAEVRQVATKLREYRVPTDVLHLDTGWFETDWQSNYEFSTSRFDSPPKMITDLRTMGLRISLWQYTYFTRKNKIWDEMYRGGYAVRNESGAIGDEDATLDFSNPAAIRWYQGKLKGLLDMGVSVIKADFGEGAPLTGLYQSGRTGWYEHNLYPVRYNKAVWTITDTVSRGAGARLAGRAAAGGETASDGNAGGVIWGRSAWAGSQRYPLHWGGDAENTNSAMAATLRGGLSLGLSGFSFWSHDIGGFVNRAPRDLYRRWTPFGALTSHTRTHGAPPREPWEYDSAFVVDFRRAIELKYRLMPYVYAQAKASSAKGYPMTRALFFEYPDDPTSWLIEDEYFFGSDLLVAPLFDSADHRRVYLPPGSWIDYQTGRAYTGGAWHDIRAGAIPIVLLARNGSVIPHTAVAQHTGAIDWSNIELRVFTVPGGTEALTGEFALPGGPLHEIELRPSGSGYSVSKDPLAGRVHWRATRGQP
ncbi:MAG TPA: TIM-barrel domain-containing protein [Gemmatimonadaceae bacterium]|nr:TIM-barrel domain-containing protein [Gemmatimonadaceae bacterium]